MPTSEILLFHHSDKVRNWTDDYEPSQQAFFWFSDRFHELTAIGSEFIYFFLVNPKRDNVALSSRPYAGGFHGLFATYKQRREEFDDPPKHSNNRWHTEPAFVSSYSQLIPSLGARFDAATETYTILFPKKHAGKQFRLFDKERRRRTFIEVPELVASLPGIINAYPFVLPPIVNNQYFFPDWVDEHSERAFNATGLEHELQYRK